jgi:hypothetical protein
MDGGPFDIWATSARAVPSEGGHDQDRVRLIEAYDGAGRGVVVCDGVGSLPRSGPVAEAVAECAAEYVARTGVRRGIAGLGFESGAAHAVQHVAESIEPTPDGATTLIAVGADAEGYVAYSFVGNGTLLDIEAVSIGEGRVRLSAAELVVPHIDWGLGRPALRAFLPANGNAAVPSARGLLGPQPDRIRLLLAMTDGVATDEERTQGTGSGTTWRKVPEPLAALMAAVTAGWNDFISSPDPGESLGGAIQGTLDALARDGELTDDATVGALLAVPHDLRPQVDEEIDVEAEERA